MKSIFKNFLEENLTRSNYLLVANSWRNVANNSALFFSRIVVFLLLYCPDRFLVYVMSQLKFTRALDWREKELRINVETFDELDLRLKSCQKEPETVEWLRNTINSESIFFDVGANIGAYTLVASAINNDVKIFSFEPSIQTFNALVANIRINNLSERVKCIPFALSNCAGITRFNYSSFDSGSARHPGLLDTGNKKFDYVVTYRLDDLVRTFMLPTPTHLKIDVDGSESIVLAGAQKTLLEPTLCQILIEIDPNESDAPQIHAKLSEAGFILQKRFLRGDGTTANYWYERP
jgi:FkbM family methyltransferase